MPFGVARRGPGRVVRTGDEDRVDDPLDDWQFDLPDDAIARHPAARRDASRLMGLSLAGGAPVDHVFHELPSLLRAGDLLVANRSAVLPARLFATRPTGGRVELLLLGAGPGPVRALCRPLRRLKVGDILDAGGAGRIEVVEILADEGVAVVRTEPEPAELMARVGELPLPPYLGRAPVAADAERYQTVYADRAGSAAAPTAGLHFTPALIARLGDAGVGFTTVTLHVGLGTFRTLQPEDLARGELHEEPWEVDEAVAARVAEARAGGGRVIAVGTTSARVLESAWRDGAVRPGRGSTRLFLRPPDRLRAVDGLITNFHLPRSSLLMLVACLVGRERLLAAYAEAVTRGYRFYSYGDAMLLV
jgi:S-adenosylmethionine:tRNA ribosyltransferase-isomerase